MNYISLFDVFSYADLLLAFMLVLSPSPVPEAITLFHASILVLKGSAGVLPFKIIPGFLGPLILPVGAFVDVVSVALILMSNPPLPGEITEIVAILVMGKGVFTAASSF